MNKQYNTHLVTDELAKNHASLSPVALDFINHALQHPDRKVVLQLEQEGQSTFVRKFPFSLQTLPLFMTHAKSAEYGKIAVDLFNLYQKVVIKLAQTRPQVLNNYFDSGCADTLEHIFSGHTGLEYCLLRGDFLPTAEGLKLLEFNVSGNIGGWGVEMFEEIYRHHPVSQSFLANQSIEFTTFATLNRMVMHMVAVTASYCKAARAPNIAVLVEEPSRLEEAQDLTARIKHQLLTQAGIHIDFSCCASADEFFLRDGDIHTAAGMVDSLLLFNSPEVLPEFFHQKNKQNEFPIFNTRAAEILGQKSGLCLLSGYAQWDECSSEDRALIEAHVPWTRLLKAGKVDYNGQSYELEQLLMTHKDDFVLKPSDGMQGRDVSVGNRMSQEAWETTLKQAFAAPSPFVVQQFCRSGRLLAQNKAGELEEHDVIWGPFVFGGQYAGNVVRLGPSNDDIGVINSHRGASVAFVFLHD
jgi:hypothetical protein